MQQQQQQQHAQPGWLMVSGLQPDATWSALVQGMHANHGKPDPHLLRTILVLTAYLVERMQRSILWRLKFSSCQRQLAVHDTGAHSNKRYAACTCSTYIQPGGQSLGSPAEHLPAGPQDIQDIRH
jgi:hypothetical protein